MSAQAAVFVGFTPKMKKIKPNRATLWGQLTPLDEGSWILQSLKQILELQDLADNWDSYGSKKISALAIRASTKLLSEVPFEMLPAPNISPVAGGGVGLHWRIEGRDLELEITSEGKIEYLKTEYLGNGAASEEGVIASSKDESALWKWLVRD